MGYGYMSLKKLLLKSALRSLTLERLLSSCGQNEAAGYYGAAAEWLQKAVVKLGMPLPQVEPLSESEKETLSLGLAAAMMLPIGSMLEAGAMAVQLECRQDVLEDITRAGRLMEKACCTNEQARSLYYAVMRDMLGADS